MLQHSFLELIVVDTYMYIAVLSNSNARRHLYASHLLVIIWGI